MTAHPINWRGAVFAALVGIGVWALIMTCSGDVSDAGVGVAEEPRPESIAPWPDSVPLPRYTVMFKQQMISPSGVVVEVVVPSLNASTPHAVLGSVGLAIAHREGADRVNLFETVAAFHANEDATRQYPGYEREYLGRIEDGMFRPPWR